MVQGGRSHDKFIAAFQPELRRGLINERQQECQSVQEFTNELARSPTANSMELVLLWLRFLIVTESEDARREEKTTTDRTNRKAPRTGCFSYSGLSFQVPARDAEV